MEKKIEFDEVIAEDVGIWGDSFFVAVDDIVDDALLVFFLEVEGLEWDI